MSRILLMLMIAVVGVALNDYAHAEGGCPPGQYPRQGQGWQTCIPIPGADQGNVQPTPSPGHWEASWGALATFEPGGVLGEATGLRSKPEAESAALSDCKAKGGTGCKLEVSYQNACAALAGSATGYVVVSDPELPAAESDALATCSKAGYPNCHISYTACSKAKFVQ
jgi:hypothetical protein